MSAWGFGLVSDEEIIIIIDNYNRFPHIGWIHMRLTHEKFWLSAGSYC
jgi:hypothetical protein